ncbi:hypothetical protein [Arthrobacter sp. zg-Y1116]|uniref:hypothetical protein n=1 Tax=Arthrobacter sp. zg-Y1116 TaxID=2964611 RepID=UPI002108497C|nr:hypothetical protein [Arthrobacter sp. zg-Y1116]MCQ1946087.1 hypothetical protein [Arthrobacter sp. zg-Y1116]
MAAFVAGFPAVNDSVVAGPIAPVPLEYQKIPGEQIAPTHEGTAVAYHYETRFNPVRGEVGAEMSINTFKSDFPSEPQSYREQQLFRGVSAHC